MIINEDLVFNEVMEMVEEELESLDDLCKISCRRRGYDYGVIRHYGSECFLSCLTLIHFLLRLSLLNADDSDAQMHEVITRISDTEKKWRELYNG